MRQRRSCRKGVVLYSQRDEALPAFDRRPAKYRPRGPALDAVVTERLTLLGYVVVVGRPNGTPIFLAERR